MTDEDVWNMERRFWTGGEDYYRATLAPQCVMAFPPPAGIIAGPDVISSMKDAPRWSAISMSHTHVERPSDGLLVLGYKADAERDNGSAYAANCTSTYCWADSRWRLIQHQQTPV